MRKVVLACLLGVVLGGCTGKLAQSGGKPYGVNMACADFGSNFPGVYNTDYTYPEASDLDYWNEKGLKLIRFPFKWERLQYELGGELNQHDLEKMKAFVAAAAERDMVVLLDLHNYCRRYMNGEQTIIGTGGLTPQHLASFWKALAKEFKSFDNIYAYGLMNEPHDLDPGTTWFEMAQLCIDSIREVDRDTRIMVGGNHWSSAERWLECSDTLKYLKDPVGKLAFEAHVYFDSDASGAYKRGYDADSCSIDRGVNRVRPYVEWLKTNGFEGIVGEYGVPDNDSRWNRVLDKFLAYLQKNGINGCYWAAGPWWPRDEFMAITPVDGKDRPQMEVVGKYKTTKR
ncbi:MAG TPA: glycoside hydrolase family 5 protein [Candidatus Barnesiella merdipullorum]|nr:glycoside hydrolase family 5 protein [Candidatus Barnesiella merdipullorum]